MIQQIPLRLKQNGTIIHLTVLLLLACLAALSLILRGGWVIALAVTSFIAFTYVHVLYLLPGYLLKKRYSGYAIGLITGSFLSSYLGFGLPVKSPLDLLQTTLLVIAGIFLQLPAMAIYLLFEQNKTRIKLLEMEQLQASTELQYLQAQVNPHFLFNALNSLYSLTLLKDDKAPDLVARLSDLMRYLLEGSKLQTIPLQKEIDYLDNYIQLERIRRSGSENTQFISQGDLSKAVIAPGLLLPFVENAFKFSPSLDNEQSLISIIVSLQEDGLFFQANNTVPSTDPLFLATGTQTGLKNVRRRLELLYPGSHQLNTENDGKIFTVSLWIKL